MKLDNVKPLNIDSYMDGRKIRNKVALVGVELEGAWEKLPPGVARLEHDGSVFEGRVPKGAVASGELPLGPVIPAAVGELITKNHPHFINHTCGMHVHMSFESLWHYELLMVPEYPATMTHYLLEWAKKENFKENHHIYNRLRGESRFCRNLFFPDLQASQKNKSHDQNMPGHRYTAVHYCGRQNTIEVRVLPMIKGTKLAVRGVKEVINITNACIHELIKARGGERKKITGKITLPSNLVYEETAIDIMG